MRETFDNSSAVVIGRDGTFLEIYPAVETIPAEGYWRLPIRVLSPALSATSDIDLARWSGGAPSLIKYFDDLAAGWRGWEGAREWSDDEGGVKLSAVHAAVGDIELAISLQPSFGMLTAGCWELQIVVPIEPGQLESIARSIRGLFSV